MHQATRSPASTESTSGLIPLDDPAAFAAQRERWRVRVSVGFRVQAVSVVDVGVVDTGVLDTSQRLARPGLRRGDLAQHHVLGPAVGVDLHGFHIALRAVSEIMLELIRQWRSHALP